MAGWIGDGLYSYSGSWFCPDPRDGEDPGPPYGGLEISGADAKDAVKDALSMKWVPLPLLVLRRSRWKRAQEH